ncbi:hypothetical protein KAR02_12815, partial [Candidatus Bipolaricaulota bacterium]|nr:hypothetical protein [Candidatus Bipolaricaulota bacterium]
MRRKHRCRPAYANTMARFPRRRLAYAITMARFPHRRLFDGDNDQLHAEEHSAVVFSMDKTIALHGE